MNPFCLEHIVVLVVSLDSTLGIHPKSDHPSNVVCFCVIKKFLSLKQTNADYLKNIFSHDLDDFSFCGINQFCGGRK